MRHIHELVPYNGATARRDPFLHHCEACSLLQSCHEKHSACVQRSQPLVIDVPAVEYDHCTGVEPQRPTDRDIASAKVSDHCVRGEQPVMVQHQMQLDGTFALVVLSPTEHLRDEFHRC